MSTVSYDTRGDLRSLSPSTDDAIVVKGLGLFLWEESSTEPDDDESAFATASGVWLLEAVSWDVVALWQLPEDEVWDENRNLTGSAVNTIASLTTLTSASFTGTVIGAVIGDRVIANPPDELGSTSANTARIGFFAYVSANDTVTITLTNASASTATTNTAIRGAWPITVIKGE